MDKNNVFQVKTCSITEIATGKRASSLMELLDRLVDIDEGCLYYHFWAERMSPHYIHTQHHNGFARWIDQQLHDQKLAEQLSMIDPLEYDSIKSLRHEVIDTIEKRLDTNEIIQGIKKQDCFRFISSTTSVFNSHININHPKDFAEVINKLPLSSIYYHFIDTRWHTPEKLDDFSLWLATFGDSYTSLIYKIRAINPYFFSMIELKNELIRVIQGKQ